MPPEISITILVILGIVVYRMFTGKTSEVIGNWEYLIIGLQYDTEAFYDLFEKIINEHRFPGFKCSRVYIRERHMLSKTRLYFQVEHGDFQFHICGAPWGDGFFVSWWYREQFSDLDSALKRIPFIGKWIHKLRSWRWYYQLDTDAMFRISVHTTMLEAIERISSEKGIRGLTELEKKPAFKKPLF